MTPPPVPTDPKARPEAPQPACRNRILAALPPEELALVRPHLFRVSLVASQVLFEKGVPVDAVYFVEQGLLALLAEVGGGERIQIGMVGFEGVRGSAVMLQPDLVTAYQTVVEVAGWAWRLQAADFLRVIPQAPVLRAQCLDAINAFFRQIAQTSACNGKHDLPSRLCRLLLMAHDRSADDDVLLTQSQIARMIGVRRAGVSTVMATLQDEGLLRQSRGRITLLDPQGLQALACACYAEMALI
ncbi:MAG: Crp/Fnr family transcriptional regulator [Janthinobacterium lividum]